MSNTCSCANDMAALKRENTAYRMSVQTLKMKLEATRKVVGELREELKKKQQNA